MRKLIVLALYLSIATAQESRKEITTEASPADGQPNSPKVPDVVSIPSQFERVVLLRFKYNVDLLASLEDAIKKNKIQNGVFLSGFGSVTGYQVHQVSNRTFPSKNMFVKDPTAPADIIGASGYIMNGRAHAHLALANPDKAFGGHLEPGTTVFTFACLTVGVLPANLDISKLDDKNFR